MRRAGWLGILVLAATPLSGAFDAVPRDLMGTRSVGMAGADLAAAEGLEALFGNPAALPESADIGLGLYSAAADGRLLAGAGLASGIRSDLRLGMSYVAHQDSRYLPLLEQTLGLAAALELRPGLQLGVRFKGMQMESGPVTAVRGVSLDLGLLKHSMAVPLIPGSWSLALGGNDLAGAWPSQAWAQALPTSLKLGLGWQPVPGAYFGAEHAWTSAPQLAEGAQRAWRLGGEWRFGSEGPALRAGWRDEAGAEWSLGAGLGRLPWIPGQIEYGMLWRQDSGGFSHRLSLQVSFLRKRELEMRAEPVQLIRDPDSGQIRQARLRVDIDPALNPRDWRVELVDKDGKAVKILKPEGGDLSARYLEWDGLDDAGQPVDADVELRAALVVDTPEGSRRRLSEESLGLALAKSELKARAAADSASAIAAPELRPIFDSADASKLSHVLVKMPELKSSQMPEKGWALDFSDSNERVLRHLEGEGAMPKEVVWDGKDSQGRLVKDALGVQVKVEVKDRSGKKVARAMPLFSQKAFEIASREARQRPVLQLASLGLPLALGREALDYADGFLSSLIEGARLRQAQAAKASAMKAPSAGGPKAAARTGLASALPRAERRAALLGRKLPRVGIYGMEMRLEEAMAGKGIKVEVRPQSRPAARYVLPRINRAFPPTSVPARAAAYRVLKAVLEGRGWLDHGAEGLAISPDGSMAAFHHGGWVWLSDPEARRLRSVWFEPDLKAAGQIAWRADGKGLRLRADGWRHWLDLDLHLEPEQQN